MISDAPASVASSVNTRRKRKTLTPRFPWREEILPEDLASEHLAWKNLATEAVAPEDLASEDLASIDHPIFADIVQ